MTALVLVGAGLRLEAALEGSKALPPDALAYAALGEGLYEEGRYQGEEVERASGFAPGLPLLVAASHHLTGGDGEEPARVLIALLGGATVLISFLIGGRLGGPVAGLLAATAVAVYPALVDYHRVLLTEPLAAFLLAASVAALLRGLDPGRRWPWWALAGVLLGSTALVRAEYVAIGLGLLAVAAAVTAPRVGWQRAGALLGVGALGLALTVAPWTVRNAIVLDRFLPVADGGGRALFFGTYVPAYDEGFSQPDFRVMDRLAVEYPWLEAAVARRFPGSTADPPTTGPRLIVIGKRRFPGSGWDEVASQLAGENLDRYAWGDPLGFARFLARKQAYIWSHGATPRANELGWRILHLALLALALAGLALLALQRRREAAVLGALVAAVILVASLTQASPRRNLVLAPELAALAGAAVARVPMRRTAVEPPRGRKARAGAET